MIEFRYSVRDKIIIATILIAGIALASALAFEQRRENAAQVKQRLGAESQRFTDRLVTRMQTYEFGLRAARSAVTAIGPSTIDHKSFHAYIDSSDIDSEFPGARGFGLIRRVPLSEEGRFLAAQHRERSDFSLRTLSDSTTRDERFIIQYIEPIARNREAIGLDIASEEFRREAAVNAMRTGKPALTAPITLVQASGQTERAFLFLLPLYPADVRLPDQDERERATWGWVYAPLVMDEILQSLDLTKSAFALELDDVTNASAEKHLHAYGESKSIGPQPTSVVTERDIYGRTWRIRAIAQPAFVRRLQLTSPFSVFFYCWLFTITLTALVAAYLAGRHRKTLMVNQQLQLARVVESTNEAIVTESLAGTIDGWNRAAERIFGYTAAEMLGKTVIDVVACGQFKGGNGEFRNVILAGEEVEPFDTTCRRRDGSLQDISVAAALIKSPTGLIEGIGYTIRDITERKQAERELLKFKSELEQQVAERTRDLETAQRDLRTLFDAVPSMIGYWDSNLINRFANKAYGNWFAIDPSNIAGKHIKQLLGSELFELNRVHIEAALRGEHQVFERAIPKPDSTDYRYSLTYYIPDQDGDEVRGFYVLVHDISEITESRRKLAAALKRNDALLSTLHRHAIVSIADKTGRIIEANDQFVAISGYSREELIGKNHRLVNSGQHSKEFWREMWRTISAGNHWRGEICNRAKDGSLYWVESVIAPYMDDDGRVRRYMSIRTDVTARKLATAQLAQERQQLDNILRGTNAGTWEMNLRTGEIRVNDRWAEMIGYSLQEIGALTTENCFRYAHPDEIESALAAARKHISGETDEYRYELRAKHKDGSWVWVIDHGRIMTRTADGKPEWMAGTRQDISARREMEESLRKATAKAEAASAAKSQFLANMSHEIRTPLNAVIGLAYLLEDSPLSADQRSSLNKIQIAGRSLLSVINNVLDLSKIEAGEMDIESQPFDIHELFAEVEQLMIAQTEKKGLLLIVPHAPPTVPKFLLGDVTRLRQIFVNLLGNALKFTQQGCIELRAEVIARADSEVRLKFTVSDTGIGIPPEAQSKLFSPFSQADSSTTRRFGGTGLGLSIVRQLTELMGGTIGVNSVVGEGSDFWVEIPFNIANAAQSDSNDGSEIASSLIGARVLIVDDSDVNVEVASRILLREGAVVESCSDGQQAVDRLAKNDAFDIVLMDIQMPVRDGISATEYLRTELKLTLPVIALTAGALVTERQRALDAGMNDFITKPINPKALIKAVRRYAGRTASIEVEQKSVQADEAVAKVVTTAWPSIEGIDFSAVGELLNDDVSLFMSLIQRFVAEYGDLSTAVLRDLNDAELRKQLVGRMHKLRGSAGTLGATRIQTVAAHLESTLKEPASDITSADLMQELSVLMTSLVEQVHVATVHRTSPDPVGEKSARLSSDQLDYFLQLLATQDLSALDYFDNLKSIFQATYTPSDFAAMELALQRLDFALVATLARAMPLSA